MIDNPLYEFMPDNSLSEVFQSRFRMYHTTETALVKITEDLSTGMDEGLISVLILLDLNSALDTVEDQLLMQRLDNLIGIK